jgi:two-component system, oxyanion-binding sensor
MIKIRAGFLPLIDAAVLIAAQEKGFAASESIELQLSRETSWANIRDRLSVGQLDVAHMLAPLPVAQNLGLSPLKNRIIVPFALGLGGNAITVSKALFQKLQAFDASCRQTPILAGAALKHIIDDLDNPKLTFAVVHTFSSHAYELRYWMAACGIDPLKDVNITIVPPSMMGDALAAGSIDGFCVGEPWNSVAAAAGSGIILSTKSQIWRSSPEKVLGVTEKWAMTNPEIVDGLIVALHRSALWCQDSRNHVELAKILSREIYIGVPASILQSTLDCNLPGLGTVNSFISFADGAANFPWQSHALWFFSQMVRWKEIAFSIAATDAARATYRPDIYRRALAKAGVAMPGGSSKVEGTLNKTTLMPALGGELMLGPDGFFDGKIFDPDQIESYVTSFR